MAFRPAFRPTHIFAGALTGLFRLAALNELAERVRPTTRRVRGQERIDVPGEDAGEDAGEAAAAL